MSLILKSNVAVRQNKLTDIIPNAALSLDFRDGVYLKNNVVTDISSILQSSITSTGYYEPTGEYKTKLGGATAVSTDLKTYKKGLLIQGTIRNYFLNSFTPVSQSISVPVLANGACSIYMFGGGSVQVKVGGVLLGTATESKPVVYPTTTTTQVTFDLVVAGQVSFVSVTPQLLPIPIVTRVATTSSAISRNADEMEFKPSVLTELLTNFTGCLVFEQYTPSLLLNNSSSVQTVALAAIVDPTSQGFFIAKGNNKEYKSGVRAYKSGEAEKFNKSYKDIANTLVVAINFSKTGAKMAINGDLIDAVSIGSTELSRILIGSTSAWSETQLNYIQQALIFNRHLTDDELVRITS